MFFRMQVWEMCASCWDSFKIQEAGRYKQERLILSEGGGERLAADIV